MQNIIVPILTWGSVLFLLAFVTSLILTVLNFRRARTGKYYVIREDARRVATRWMYASIATLILGLVLVFARSRFVGPSGPTSTAAPPPTPTHSLLNTPVPSDTPGQTPSPSPSPRPSSTPTLPPSPEPTRPVVTPPFSPPPTSAYPLPDTALTPLPNTVPAAADAQINVVAFALREENGQPVSPTHTFVVTDSRVYVFFEYQNMDQTIEWTYGWYLEDEYLDGNTCRWGTMDEDCPRIFGRNGANYLFYRLPGGYVPGTYHVRLWIEERYQGVASFTMTEAP